MSNGVKALLLLVAVFLSGMAFQWALTSIDVSIR